MNPQKLRQGVRELEIRARLEARIHSRTKLVRSGPPIGLSELEQARYMRAYRESYRAFENTDQKDWT